MDVKDDNYPEGSEQSERSCKFNWQFASVLNLKEIPKRHFDARGLQLLRNESNYRARLCENLFMRRIEKKGVSRMGWNDGRRPKHLFYEIHQQFMMEIKFTAILIKRFFLKGKSR